MHKSCQDSKRIRWSYCNCNCLSWVYPVTSQRGNKIEQKCHSATFWQELCWYSPQHKNSCETSERGTQWHSCATTFIFMSELPHLQGRWIPNISQLLHTDISPTSFSFPCPSAQRCLSVKALLQKQLRVSLGSSVFLKVYHSFPIFIDNSWFINYSWWK